MSLSPSPIHPKRAGAGAEVERASWRSLSVTCRTRRRRVATRWVRRRTTRNQVKRLPRSGARPHARSRHHRPTTTSAGLGDPTSASAPSFSQRQRSAGAGVLCFCSGRPRRVRLRAGRTELVACATCQPGRASHLRYAEEPGPGGRLVQSNQHVFAAKPANKSRSRRRRVG